MTKPGTPHPLPGAVETLTAAAQPVPARPAVEGRLKATLSGFMFVQYFIWGAWYPSMGTYLANQLQFPGAQIGATYGAFAIGAIVSPFFVGLIANRYFAAEKLLAVLGLLGAVTLVGLSTLRDFSGFYPVLILYCALFVPTLALGNSLAMQHLTDAKRDFPRIKIASAIGWIAGGVTISWVNAEQSAVQFQVAAAASLAFAAYALTLPHTPPKVAGAKRSLGQIVGLDALALLKRRSFGTFVGCLFLITIPLKCYFVLMSIYLTELQWANVSGKMALAQISDIVFLLVMPFMLHWLGYKRTILIGMTAWALRYWLLAQSVDALALQAGLIFTAILLHGICYDFLYIAGQLYVNAEANDGNRSAAQGLVAFVLWGVGPLAGTFLAGKLLAAQRLPSPVSGLNYDWAAAWMVPAVFAAIIMVVFAALFRDPSRARDSSILEKAHH
jgi:nucleoside transporter